jgi:CheY-like chemotaxis protein
MGSLAPAGSKASAVLPPGMGAKPPASAPAATTPSSPPAENPDDPLAAPTDGDLPEDELEWASAEMTADAAADKKMAEMAAREQPAVSGKFKIANVVPVADSPVLAALVRRGLLTTDQATKAAATHSQRGGLLTEVLLQGNLVPEGVLADVLAKDAKVIRFSDADLLTADPDAALIAKLPNAYALGRRHMPLSLKKGLLRLAVQDPFEASAIASTQSLLGADEVEVLVVSRAALVQALLRTYEVMGADAGAAAGQAVGTVLLCDVDAVSNDLLGARLVQEGYRVELADHTQGAKNVIEARPPDAIITVHQPPAFDALNLVIFVRATENLADLPIFVIAGDNDADLAEQALELGADDVFEEPTRLDLVVAKLKRALKKRPAKKPGQNTPPPGEPSDSGGEKAAPAPVFPHGLSEPTDEADPDSMGIPEFDTSDDVPGPPAADLDNESGDAGDDPFGAVVPGQSASALINADGVAIPIAGEPTGVMGTLKQMGVAEIIQSLNLGRKTAVIELTIRETVPANIGVAEGEVVSCTFGESEVGEEAFYALAPEEEGFFRIRYGQTPPTKNVSRGTTFLLLEAMRRLDENAEEPKFSTFDDSVNTNESTPFD